MKWHLLNEVILNTVNNTMEWHVLLALAKTIMVTTTFDYWMSWDKFDIFVLGVNYINNKLKSCDVIIGIFEVHKTIKITMATQLEELLVHFGLCDKVSHIWETKVLTSRLSPCPYVHHNMTNAFRCKYNLMSC
jgi:hypothetical protein